MVFARLKEVVQLRAREGDPERELSDANHVAGLQFRVLRGLVVQERPIRAAIVDQHEIVRFPLDREVKPGNPGWR